MRREELAITQLGSAKFDSPLRLKREDDHSFDPFVNSYERIRLDVVHGHGELDSDLSFEAAGPRSKIYFDPPKTTAAIVTCGGLSPGLNNVIRTAYMTLAKAYGVRRVLGIRQGYLGLNPASGLEPLTLTSEDVADIDHLGGTILASSRGPQEPAVMVDFMRQQGIDILLCVGGDGTQRGAHALHEEVQRQQAKIAIVGIPKTIDNDVPFVDISFGYATALERAAEVIRGAHAEARGAGNGIGLVRLMGRHAGFIAAGAAVVSQEVNVVLIPEIDFPLEGPSGLLAHLEHRLETRDHAVVVVAEGAGQHLLSAEDQRRDASGNLLYDDIGQFLKRRINEHFKQLEIPIALKYLDPSYFIRSCPASAYDRFLCDQMAREAVHAGMAGKTGLIIGYRHNRCIHVPIPTVVRHAKTVEPHSQLWQAALQVTGQPIW